MISSRMLSIIEYLKKHPKTSYREIAVHFKLKERSVRYDIERINDALSLEGKPIIERGSKGSLAFPDGVDLTDLRSAEAYVYSAEERHIILLLTLLLSNEDFKINGICRKLNLSRSTIKKDVSYLEKKLSDMDLSLTYQDNRFVVSGLKGKRVRLLNHTFYQCINMLLNPPEKPNPYQRYCVDLINRAFHGIDFHGAVACINHMLEANNTELTDNSYRWYLSNFMVLVWFIVNQKDYPLDSSIMTHLKIENFTQFLKRLEEILHWPINQCNARYLLRLLELSNKCAHATVDTAVDLVEAETLTLTLISDVTKVVDLPFQQDPLLVEGLLGHVIAMIARITNHVSINENMISLLGEEDMGVYGQIKAICLKTPLLKDIDNEDELVYLAIYFLASIKRMSKGPGKRVLLVCGHGYGTTQMLKETLTSEYQIRIVDTIPLYKLRTFDAYEDVDMILTTTPLLMAVDRPSLLVNPLLKKEDYQAIEALGVPRKSNLSNYYAVEDHLMFLGEADRKRVMAVLEKDLGYQSIRQPKIPRNFTSLLPYDCIACHQGALSWQAAVDLALKPLLKRKYIEWSYRDEVFDTLRDIGFYAITDGAFALLHGKAKKGVNKTSISLLINDPAVDFEGKQVKVIFCLAAKNPKDHIPAMITLMRMVKKTDLIARLQKAPAPDEVYQEILQCEFEVT